MDTLVLGLGNLLLADEGVGVHAARALMSRITDRRVTILDIGTGLLDALPGLEKAGRVIIIDALKGGGSPGSVYRLTFEECAKKQYIASMHGFDIDRVLAMAQRNDRPPIIVIGVEPAVINWSLELSGVVAQSLPAVIETVEKEILR